VRSPLVSAYKEACDGIGGVDASRGELIRNLVQEARALPRVFAERELSLHAQRKLGFVHDRESRAS
jgi:hypothetical protein